jgi:putative nucleotidyltransferase with HDIG domain
MISISSTPEWLSTRALNHRNDRGFSVGAIVGALSQALDLSTGQPVGHSIRTCVLGMRIAKAIGMPETEQSSLYYALLLKDCGCSGNSSMTFQALGSDDLKAKRDVKTTDWTRTTWESVRYAIDHVAVGKPFLHRVRAFLALAANGPKHTKLATQIRCERGSTLAQLMGLPLNTGEAILNLDEHWDGTGLPEQRRKDHIPRASQIMLLAQTLDNFSHDQSISAAMEIIERRSGKWFNPDLVRAAQLCHSSGQLWKDLDNESSFAAALSAEPEKMLLMRDDQILDRICAAFANIVDAKSPFTFNHSNGVANAAISIARKLGLPQERILFIRHAALLHDVGKLGVSNAILEKPGKLDDEEWVAMRAHAFYTWKIVGSIPGFDQLSEVAASHHEKLNGTGYFRGYSADQLSLEARILAVADIFDALAADRPYREGMPMEKVISILRQEAGKALDAECVEALTQADIQSDQSYQDLESLRKHLDLFHRMAETSSKPGVPVETEAREQNQLL